MEKYATFIFESCSFDPEKGRIELTYSLDDQIRFTETVSGFRTAATEEKINAVLFALHLIGGVSYYKTCCPKKIEICSGSLNKEQAQFWNTVYEKGLGEFWYKNGMDFRGLVKFPFSPCPPSPTPPLGRGQRGGAPSPAGGGATQGTLIPIGGGKDSIVTLEMLRDQKPTLFRMGSHPVIDEIAKIAGLPLITVERTLDPQLFDLNKNGALNGHVPITAYVSCLAVVVAELFGFDEIAISCEKSASEGNVEYLGMQVNHQWSKGVEFGRMFQEYIQTYIHPNLRYWSPVREMTELEIVKEFVKYPQYWKCTTSCNKNWTIKPHPRRDAAYIKNIDMKTQPHPFAGADLWCKSCPKCAFVFALYAAYLPKKTVLEIFEKNLFEEKELIPTYRRLLGIEGFKPFECVGTPEETRQAFLLAGKNGFTVPLHAYS